MSQVASANPTQYAVKKRRRPQPRSKNAEKLNQIKSNPSKRHRDRLNSELERLSQLIPLPTDVVNKLDKLSILRLSVAYLRNKSYSKYVNADQTKENNQLASANQQNKGIPNDISESELALQALEGFIMVITQDFNVFYITSNVQDCLGFPQSDIMYLSMLDLIHAEDRKLFMRQMQLNPLSPSPDQPIKEDDPPEVPEYVKHGLTPDVVKQLSQDGLLHRSFICRLRCLHDTSSGFLALHFTGHLGLVPGQNHHSENGTQLPPELGLFLLACPLQTPSILEIRTKSYIFRTKHKLDYTPLGVDQKGRIVLGYTEQELRQQSGYQFIHSADMMHCADAHTKLMRKGQSGSTVFRLLHRANRWQWVTASARLVYTKGQPDYIISTHRPITDQEGEEHLKTRSSAFRFDFTGHASLYASVNPIGAGPPPSNNNRSYGAGAPETKPQITSNGPAKKRARITNGHHTSPSIDPATLFGAQSLQSMDNYKDGLPIIEEIKTSNSPPNLGFPEVGVKSEPDPINELTPRDFSGYFKQKSPPFSATSLSPDHPGYNQAPNGLPDLADSGYSDNDYQPSPPYKVMLAPLTENEPPPLHHPPPLLNYPPITTEGNAPYGNQYDPYSSNGNYQSHMQPATNYNHVNQPVGNANALGQVWNENQPDRPSNQYQGYSSQPSSNVNGHYPKPSMQQATGPGPNIPAYQGYQQPANPGYQEYQAQNPSHSLYSGTAGAHNYHGNSHITSQSKENASVLNSFEISSVTTTQRFNTNDDGTDELDEILGACASFLDQSNGTGDSEITLQCEEHRLQIDLDKIAAEYQTVNPYGVIQDYVHNNPSEAMKFAKGMIGDKQLQGSMPPPQQVPPIYNGVNGQPEHFTSCQYQNGNIGTQPPLTNQMPPHMNPPHMNPPPMNPPPIHNPANLTTDEVTASNLDFSLDDFINF